MRNLVLEIQNAYKVGNISRSQDQKVESLYKNFIFQSSTISHLHFSFSFWINRQLAEGRFQRTSPLEIPRSANCTTRLMAKGLVHENNLMCTLNYILLFPQQTSLPPSCFIRFKCYRCIKAAFPLIPNSNHAETRDHQPYHILTIYTLTMYYFQNFISSISLTAPAPSSFCLSSQMVLCFTASRGQIHIANYSCSLDNKQNLMIHYKPNPLHSQNVLFDQMVIVGYTMKSSPTIYLKPSYPS